MQAKLIFLALCLFVEVHLLQSDFHKLAAKSKEYYKTTDRKILGGPFTDRLCPNTTSDPQNCIVKN
jgi:hypothetical protein